MNRVLGLYLFVIKQKSPEKFRIITSWRNIVRLQSINHKIFFLPSNNLTIGDTSMYFSRGIGKDDLPFKELVVGFKTIYINTYTTIVIDLGEDITDGRQTL